MKDKTFKTIDEYEQHYFPNNELDRLEEKLCNYLGLTKPHQHKLHKDADNPLIGNMEVAKPPFSALFSVDKIVAEFYRGEKYRVDVKSETSTMILKKDDKEHYMLITESDTSYVLFVCESFGMFMDKTLEGKYLSVTD